MVVEFIATKTGEVLLDKCLFENNLAHDSGGGLYQARSGSVISNCVFTRNGCESYGGGICNNYSGEVTLRNSVLTHNRGKYGGGAYTTLEKSPLML